MKDCENKRRKRVMGRKTEKEGLETLGILASRYTVHLLTYIKICTPEFLNSGGRTPTVVP